MQPSELRIEDFNYFLPEDRIVKYPLANRESSKLLMYNQDKISHHVFGNLVSLLSAGDQLVLNNTRVIPARLIFKKSTGGEVEIFCLDPASKDHQQAMQAKNTIDWNCMVGGAKKWKDEILSRHVGTAENKFVLHAEKLLADSGRFHIRFAWDGDLSFSEVLSMAGEIPLPPYFGREAEDDDYQRYQTVFASNEGSVAAPTAGLHLTEDILNELMASGIGVDQLTLHVGAGTFKPVTSDTLSGHDMHHEYFSVSKDLLLKWVNNWPDRIIPVGTTSMRTLESLFWLGQKIGSDQRPFPAPLNITQWEPYTTEPKLSAKEAFSALINYCDENSLQHIVGSTGIMIAPGYKFRICGALITNFHMPKSTLLLLISAFIGEDWKRVYQYALDNNFRFLSYGDSSLLIPDSRMHH
jgi:S-adenosylmethionine:tRNA ribosyltransferase-isomerase